MFNNDRERSPRQVQMNIILPSRHSGQSRGIKGTVLEVTDEILRLRFAPLRMTTSAPGRPETGTKDRTSRAMNILRRLPPSA